MQAFGKNIKLKILRYYKVYNRNCNTLLHPPLTPVLTPQDNHFQILTVISGIYFHNYQKYAILVI